MKDCYSLWSLFIEREGERQCVCASRLLHRTREIVQTARVHLILFFSFFSQLYKTKVMALSDLDATNFELEQKVLQSSMESYRRHEAGRKQRASPTLGRRRRGRHSPGAERNLPAFGTSTVAAIPPPAAAAAPPVASIASAASADSSLTADEYPQTVQELVMNGFELGKVVHAYELIGDNFDDLLTFLMSNSSS
jgi:hypothetical protein